MESTIDDVHPSAKNKFFYGWYIVGVGFLANVASAFSLASTMSVFLKPLTADLGVSRGVFSLLRSGEGLIAAFLAPVIGTLMDRYGGRWLMVFGAIIASLGYIVLSYVDNFSQFSLVRLSLITVGDSFMGYIVVNLAIAHWFSRQRGRALALTSMGIGFAKVVYASTGRVVDRLAGLAPNLAGIRYCNIGFGSRTCALDRTTLARRHGSSSRRRFIGRFEG